MKNNVVLVGMPGAGKSTVGIVLAKLLGYRFLDSDLVIQEAEGRLLKDIIEQEGIARFIEIEEKINAEIRAEHTVIATGGSVVYGKKAMENMRSLGRVVYIKLSYKEICSRVGNVKQRGIVLAKGQTFRELYDERILLYEHYADLVIDAEKMTVEETAMGIKELLK